MYFSVEMILFVLARWLLLCVLSLLAVIFGWRKLARGDRNGWVLLAASLLMPGYYGAQWVQSLLTPANRIAEVAAWPRVKVRVDEHAGQARASLVQKGQSLAAIP